MKSCRYPFGMMMPGRKYDVGMGYRYGFNGKEDDKEVKNEGNTLDFGSRIYDPRIGKWLSIDPLQSLYSFASPYNFVLNNPISFADLDGRDIILGDNNFHFWTTLLQKTFEGKVLFTVEETVDKNGYSINRFNLALRNGETFKDERQRKAFEYIKKLADDRSIQINIKSSGQSFMIDDSQPDYQFPSSPDDYNSSELNEQIISATTVDGFDINGKGKIFVHFLAEQYWAQVLNNVKPSDLNYPEAHQYALDEGLKVFEYTYSKDIILTQERKQTSDVDIIDKDGKYQKTVRRILDFTDKKHPKFTIQEFIRKDLQKGSTWVPAVNQSGASNEDIKKYFENNQINPPQNKNGNTNPQPKKKNNK